LNQKRWWWPVDDVGNDDSLPHFRMLRGSYKVTCTIPHVYACDRYEIQLRYTWRCSRYIVVLFEFLIDHRWFTFTTTALLTLQWLAFYTGNRHFI